MRKPPKPYESRVDLKPYRRLIQFSNWSPQTSKLKDPTLVPWAVYMGTWRGEARIDRMMLRRRELWLKRRKRFGEVSGIRVYPPADLAKEIERSGFLNPPVLLNGREPTTRGLLRLAEEVRGVLRILMEAGHDHYRQLYAWWAIKDHDRDQVGLQMILIASGPPGQRKRHGFALVPTARRQDFRAYCFYLLARLMADGHAWRAAKCAQCNKFFLKVRRDPPSRPSRFCKEECRRNWHNERRKGGTS